MKEICELLVYWILKVNLHWHYCSYSWMIEIDKKMISGEMRFRRFKSYKNFYKYD